MDYRLADSELRLHPSARSLTVWPTVFRSERGCDFAVLKVAEKAYRGQFHYRGYEQYRTEREEYDDLAECVTALLQVQAGHEKERAGAFSGAVGKQTK